MSTRKRGLFTCQAITVLGLILGLALLVPNPAGAFIYTFYGDSQYGDFTLNGGAASWNPNSDHVLRLASTSEGGSLARSAFLTGTTTLVSDYSFSSVFQFQITGVDGLTFTMQKDPRGATALGSAGGYLGFADGGMLPGVAVEFDTFYNDGWQEGVPSGQHVGIDTNNSVASLAATSVSNLSSGQTWTAWVDYNGSTMKVWASQTSDRTHPTDTPLLAYDLNLANLFSNDHDLYLGFTAGTFYTPVRIDVLYWEFNNVPLPSTLLLLGSGLLGLGGLAWRRRRS
jgi:hypothetical protein